MFLYLEKAFEIQYSVLLHILYIVNFRVSKIYNFIKFQQSFGELPYHP